MARDIGQRFLDDPEDDGFGVLGRPTEVRNLKIDLDPLCSSKPSR